MNSIINELSELLIQSEKKLRLKKRNTKPFKEII